MSRDVMDDARFFWTDARVRYGETDQMGVVYHANYLVYFELGRTELIRTELGTAYRDLEADGLRLPVVEAGLSFRSAAAYDEKLRIGTRVAEVSGVRIRFEYEVRAGKDGRLLAEGYTRLACVDEDARPRRFPPEMHTKLRGLAERE